MISRRVVLAVVVLLLLGIACGSSGTTTTGGYTPSAYELAQEAERAADEAERVAARETAVAQWTREAMQSQARGTAEALDNAARATAQAQSAQMTADAQRAQSTVQAWAFQTTQEAAAAQATQTADARNAAATRVAMNATATEGARQVTQTAEARQSRIEETRASAQAFAVEATRAAIQRQSEREDALETARRWGTGIGIAIGAILLIAGVTYLAWRGIRVWEDRRRMMQFNPDHGEPVMVIDRERFALPWRVFGAYADLLRGEERMPELAPPEYQEGASKRAQVVNVIAAQQRGEVARAENQPKERTVIQTSSGRQRVRPARMKPIKRRRSVPGLRGEIDPNRVAPKLLEAIQEGWDRMQRLPPEG